MTQPADISDPLIGTMIGRYRVERKIGQGGMGAVYSLLQPAIQKRQALKLLHEQYAERPEIVQRFFGEARAVNLIGHPNIVDISDFSHLPDGRPFIIMEYLQGESLEEYLDREGRLSLEEISAFFEQISSALHAAHEKGIVHRDLKPENIFITQLPDGRAHLKVLDFGIAKLRDKEDQVNETQEGVVLGTPTYMSPEQAEGNSQNADHRTDVYSLGVMLYQMLSGTPPFKGKTFAELIVKHLQAKPPSLVETGMDLSPKWQTVVETALAKRPEDRFQSMQAFNLAVQEIAEIPKTVAARGETIGYATQKKSLLPWIVTGAALVMGGIGLVVGLGKSDGEAEEAKGIELVAQATAAEGEKKTGAQIEAALPKNEVETTQAVEKSAVGSTVLRDAGVEVGGEKAEEFGVEEKGKELAESSEIEDKGELVADALEEEKDSESDKKEKTPKKKSATLLIGADPWAQVFLDGKKIGQTPMEIKVTPGRHKLRLYNPVTGESRSHRVSLKKGGRKRLVEKWGK